jgi:uncharacterized protein YjbI with pentapeptide repeats
LAAPIDKITQTQLEDSVKKHGVFLKGIRGGARAVFKFKDLSDLDFRQADLSQADFTGSLLAGADLSGGTFRGVSFFACDLRNANLEKGNFSRADLRGAYLAGANLTSANLDSADMREGAILERGENGVLAEKHRPGIIGVLHKTVLAGAKLKDANLSNARAIRTDFSDADLSGVIIKDAEMHEANFGRANLSDADFTGSSIVNANMNASIMTGTVMAHVESAGANLSEALTEKAMGIDFEGLQKTLPELLEDHTAWVASIGTHGSRLDLSGYDLRYVPDMRRYSLTAIKAVGGNFLNQNLEGVEMQSALADRADFRDCRLVGADLRGSSFKNALFSRANLANANCSPLHFTNEDGTPWLQRVNMSGANLRYCILRGANLSDAILMGADFSYAILIDCDLRRADLTGVSFEDAELLGCHIEGALLDRRYQHLQK